jgi:general secretion pathway protein A
VREDYRQAFREFVRRREESALAGTAAEPAAFEAPALSKLEFEPVEVKTMNGDQEGMDQDLEGLVDGAANGNGAGRRVSRERIEEASADPVKMFSLAAQPFADNVNPEFFFRTEAHEEAFMAMKQCIEEHVSLGLTTAISGTGKTLLTQVLLQELDPRLYKPILVLAYPGMSRTALLREIVAELKVENLPARLTTHAVIAAIQGHIINLYLKGMRLVLIIDEVHFLSADSLHILRTLSNIEVPEQKLVTVLLFGEQSFLTKLQNPAYRSVFSRMFARTDIRPLKRTEVEQYVKFRLLMAAGNPGLFSEDSYDLISDLSQGIPREVNRICHVSLGVAARHGARQVTGEMIQQLREKHRI